MLVETTLLPTTPQVPESVQPGGGFCMSLELAWGKLRRAFLRTCRSRYVAHMRAKRLGACAEHDRDVIDSRDLKYLRNVCPLSFRPEDDPFQWRSRLGLARYGLAELIIFSLAMLVLGGVFASLAIHAHPVFWLGVVVPLVVWLEIVYFFRDPERVIPAAEDGFVSPADGTVTNIEETDEPEMGRVLRISIFLSIFNVHVNRQPCAGVVTAVRYFPGAYLDARNPDSAVRNEQLWIDLESEGKPVRVKQISGAIARRIVCWLKAGDAVEKGERLGMIKFGSRTDLLIPVGWAHEVLVKVGDKVNGGATIILRTK